MDARPAAASRRCLCRLLAAAAVAAAAGSAPATTGLGDSPAAIAKLCRESQQGRPDAQFQLAWVFVQAPAGQRRHDWAAWLLQAAAARGHAGARRTLEASPWPAPVQPQCMAAGAPASRSAAPAAGAARAPTVEVEAPAAIEYQVRLLAPRYLVTPRLALAIIDVESKFNPAAVSSKNAKGLMQLMPETAERFGVRDPFDPRQNIQGGMAYLRWLLAYYQGDVELVAAAFNAGEGAVDRHKGIPPYDETQDYVRRVIERVGNARLPFDARVTAPSSELMAIRSLKR